MVISTSKEVVNMVKVSVRRNKGEGSINELGNGRYKVTMTVGTDIDGRQKRKCATVNSRKAALEKLAEFKLKYRSAEEVTREASANLTFQEYVAKWLQLKKISIRENTIRSYETIINTHFNSVFGMMKLSKITTDHINTYFLGKIKDDKASSSLTVQKTLLSSIFRSALHSDIITKNPVSTALRLPKGRSKVDIELPSEEEIKHLLRKAKELQERPHYYDYLYQMCLLFLATGLRRGEMANLKWDWIDFNKNQISVKAQATVEGSDRPLKSQSAKRTLYVNADVLKEIQKIPKETPFVFFKGNSYIHLETLQFEFRKIFDAAELPSTFTIHDLRHYHATVLIKQGVNVKVVSQRLGHADITTTLNKYVHFMPSVDESASNIIGSNYIV